MNHSLCRLLLIFAAFGICFNVTAVRTGRMFSDPDYTIGEYVDFCRTDDGFLWVATGSSLLKFDGNNYVSYRRSNDSTSLSDSRILRLLGDSKGRLWVATADGLNLYDSDSDSFRRISLPAITYGGYIIDLTEQNDGTITFIASGLGLYVIDESNGEPTAVRFMPNLPDEQEQTCIIHHPNGRFYIGTHSGKVYCVSPNGATTCIPVSDGYISDIIAESDGNILVGSVGDIYRINPQDNSVTTIWPSDMVKRSVTNFTRGRDGAVYYGSVYGGVWKIDEGASVITPCSDIYIPMTDLRSTKLGAIYIDDTGNLWIGCQYHGFACIPSKLIPFSYHRLSDVLPGFKGGIDGFGVFGDKIVLGYGVHLAILSADGELLSKTDVPGGGSIRAIEPLGGNRLLLGVTNNGIWEMNTATGALQRVFDYPGKYPQIVAKQLPGGDLLIGFNGVGLMRYNPATKEQKWYPHNPEGGRLNNPFFASMAFSHDSTKVWIGLFGGLSCYDIKADELKIITQQPFLQGATYALAPLKDGTVLVGTSHGLIHCDADGKVKRKYTTADGLTDNDIRSISPDRNGGCWIGTRDGLSYLRPGGREFVEYYGGYGLFERSFNYSGLTSGNTLVLGSDLGLTMAQHDSIPAVGFDRPIAVTSILLNGKRINRATCIAGDSVMSGSVDRMRLNLPYKENSLTIRLSTLDFRDAKNVRYLWRIAGLSEDWTATPPGESVIYLPHLDPGTWRLHIKATDNNIESDETVITIVISTPWYMSGMAKLLYAMVLICLIVLTVVVMNKKKSEKIYEAKIRFFMDVSHEIRSPITLILSPLEQLLKEPFPPAVNEKLRTMYRNGQRILSLVNQLLDLRKIDKGRMRMICRPTNLLSFIGELVDMFKPQAADKKISLEFRDEGGVPDKCWVDRDNFDKILVNIISNAIKYTPKEGSVDVVLRGADDPELGRCAEVSVIDTGIGLSNKTQEQIFARFYRARENHATGIAGVGIGLDLCRQLTLLHHGSISAANRGDGVRGSIFTVRIPLDESRYEPEELLRDTEENSDGDDSEKRLLTGSVSASKSTGVVKHKRKATPSHILVVDDDAEMREFIGGYLAEQGYKVTEACDGAKALQIVNEGNIDLVVCDVKMPVMDGLSFLRIVKSNVDTHHIPVVLLSSRNDTADRIEGWGLGADGYLGKPFSTEELDSIIENLIGGRLKLKGKFSGAQDVGGGIEPPKLKGNDEALMEKIMTIINEQIDNPELNVEMLSRSIGISRVQLHRKLKDIIGMTPSDFIRNIRLKRATVLLQNPDVDISQVAYAVGFSSQPHFSTAFKKFTGYAPTEYRQRCLSGDVPDPGLPATPAGGQ